MFSKPVLPKPSSRLMSFIRLTTKEKASIATRKSVAGAAFDTDPYMSGTTEEAAAKLQTYWEARHSDVQLQVETH